MKTPRFQLRPFVFFNFPGSFRNYIFFSPSSARFTPPFAVMHRIRFVFSPLFCSRPHPGRRQRDRLTFNLPMREKVQDPAVACFLLKFLRKFPQIIVLIPLVLPSTISPWLMLFLFSFSLLPFRGIFWIFSLKSHLIPSHITFRHYWVSDVVLRNERGDARESEASPFKFLKTNQMQSSYYSLIFLYFSSILLCPITLVRLLRFPFVPLRCLHISCTFFNVTRGSLSPLTARCCISSRETRYRRDPPGL